MDATFDPQKMAKTSRAIVANRRVLDVLRLLDRSPLPAHLILKASVTFGTEEDPDDGFTDIRRVRERMQHLAEAGFVAIREYPLTGHGVMNFYHLTPMGYRILYQAEPEGKDAGFFREVAPTRREHTFALAKVIVHTLVGAHNRSIAIVGFKRENSFPIKAAGREQKPDGVWQFETSGKLFNYLFEVDMGTAPIDAAAGNSIKNKIVTYEAYYDHAWHAWKRGNRRGRRPRFRVVFLTTTTDRAEHILVEAGKLARNGDRRLCYAATIDSYLGEADPLVEPLFLDHAGNWQALVNLQPSSPFTRPPVRFRDQSVEPGFLVC